MFATNWYWSLGYCTRPADKVYELSKHFNSALSRDDIVQSCLMVHYFPIPTNIMMAMCSWPNLGQATLDHVVIFMEIMSWLSRKAIIIILSWIDLSSLGLLTWEDYSDVTMPYYTGTWCLFVRPYGDGMTACTEDDYCRDCSLIDSISEQQAINEIFPNNISILPADVKRSLQNTQQPSADGYVLNITPNTHRLLGRMGNPLFKSSKWCICNCDLTAIRR